MEDKRGSLSIAQRAAAAGAASLREPTLKFYGDRMSAVTDTFGNQYWIATHVADVSEEGMTRRAKDVASLAAST